MYYRKVPKKSIFLEIFHKTFIISTSKIDGLIDVICQIFTEYSSIDQNINFKKCTFLSILRGLFYLIVSFKQIPTLITSTINNMESTPLYHDYVSKPCCCPWSHGLHFQLVWRCPQLLSGFLAKRHLPRVSRQSRRSLMIG